MQEVPFTFFGLSVRVRSAVPEFTRNLARVFDAFRGPPRPGRSLASYRVAGGSPFRLFRGGKNLYETDRLHYLLEYLESDLLSVLIDRLRGHLLVHAGAASSGGRTVLLPGRAGSGKTTLITALIRKGFRYATDEMAVFDAADSLLHPFPKALNLKAPSVGLFQPLGPDLQLLDPGPPDGDRIHHLLVRSTKILPPGKPLRVDRIVFPRYGREEPDRLEPITRATAIAEIARVSFNHYRLQEAALDCLENLVRPAGCYRLTYSDLDRAVNILRNLCHAPAVRSAGGGETP